MKCSKCDMLQDQLDAKDEQIADLERACESYKYAFFLEFTRNGKGLTEAVGSDNVAGTRHETGNFPITEDEV